MSKSEGRSIIVSPGACCSVSKPECVKTDWGRTYRSQMLQFLAPVKFRRRWAKYLSEFYDFGLGLNLWYSILLAGHLSVVWVSK